MKRKIWISALKWHMCQYVYLRSVGMLSERRPGSDLLHFTLKFSFRDAAVISKARQFLFPCNWFCLFLYVMTASVTCPTGWANLTRYCYQNHGGSRNWWDARSHCTSQGEGVDLASIHSSEENTLVANLNSDRVSSKCNTIIIII